ncbi:hypothetical protein HBB16_01325 [Pseudonocardia sp. MCCB 268]|nr:hypothetical protein [Pseudonocardia cytotoxica]
MIVQRRLGISSDLLLGRLGAGGDRRDHPVPRQEDRLRAPAGAGPGALLGRKVTGRPRPGRKPPRLGACRARHGRLVRSARVPGARPWKTPAARAPSRRATAAPPSRRAVRQAGSHEEARSFA